MNKLHYTLKNQHPLDVCKSLKETIEFISKNINFTQKLDIEINIKKVES